MVVASKRDPFDQFTLERLRILDLVAERGSFRKAAEALNVHEPALVRQIEHLERRFKAKLLNRTPRGSTLTPIGEQLLPEVRNLLEHAKAVSQRYENLSKGTAGTVSIACFPVHVERFIALVIAEFKERCENASVDLSRAREERPISGTTRFDELAQGYVDLAVGPLQPGFDFQKLRLYEARIVLCPPPGHRLRRRSRVSIKELDGLPLLLAPETYPSREIIAAAARSAGFEPKVEAESTSPFALLSLSRIGMGLPVLPDDIPTIGLEDPPFPTLLDHEGRKLSATVFLQWRPDAIRPLVKEFVACARRLAKETPSKKVFAF